MLADLVAVEGDPSRDASPGLKIAGRAPFDHVSPDGRGGMADREYK